MKAKKPEQEKTFPPGTYEEAGERRRYDEITINDIQIPYVANVNAQIVTDKNYILKRKNLMGAGVEAYILSKYKKR